LIFVQNSSAQERPRPAWSGLVFAAGKTGTRGGCNEIVL
jgi:hypothetical protein